MNKTLLSLLILTGLILASPPPAAAQTRTAFGVNSAVFWAGTTNCYAVIPQAGWNAQPVVRYIYATSDKAGSLIQFRVATASATVLGTNGLATNGIVSSTAGFTNMDAVVLVRGSYPNETYTAGLCNTLQATNLMIYNGSILPGDVIYKMTQTGTIPVGNASKELNGYGIFTGPHNKPMLMLLDSTSTLATFSAIGGEYR